MRKSLFMPAFIGAILIFSAAWAGAGDVWQPVIDSVNIFQKGYIRVTGTSEGNQSRYRAIRAATVTAQRDLLEVIQGLSLTGNTTVRDGMLVSDTIKTAVNGYLRRAVKVGERYDSHRSYAEVSMQIYIRGKGGMFDIILPLATEQKLIPADYPAYEPRLIPGASDTTAASSNAAVAGSDPVVAKPSAITTPHDGLIIDARGLDFRPALVNRILTANNEVIFDPSKIVSAILVEKGCGGFTNDEAKAKALLNSWGSKTPMIVKATDVVGKTDLKVDIDEAAAIFIHDKRGNFLAQANVIFIL